MLNFENKIAVVTGSRLGIGRGVARLLAERGATLVLMNRGDTSDLAAELGKGAISVRGDVTSEADWAHLAKTVEDQFGRADILVNAAGIYPVAALTDMDYAEWRRVMATNLDSQFLGARALVPLMRKAKWGRIVNIASDVVGLVTPPGMGFSHYVASKMGVVGLTRGLANELAADGITVNAVHPGITDTEGASGMPNEVKAQVYMNQAIKRLGTPADIARTVAFLASEEADFLTGQTIAADGGLIKL
ncbi:MAG: 3-oxoacyl-ACP reductase [Devosia sp.]|nr:3-oxoacyl-ACP reductase [Devosia sp.]